MEIVLVRPFYDLRVDFAVCRCRCGARARELGSGYRKLFDLVGETAVVLGVRVNAIAPGI
jgi:hypothetical protein